MPNDILGVRHTAKDSYVGSQTVNDNLLFSILQELKTISKKLDNLHKAYKP